MLEDEDIRRIVQAVRAVFAAEQSVTGEIADRWSGGQLVLQKHARSVNITLTDSTQVFTRRGGPLAPADLKAGARLIVIGTPGPGASLTAQLILAPAKDKQ